MKSNKKSTIIVVVIAILVLGIGIFLNIAYTNNGASKVAGSMDIDEGDAKINWNQYETFEIELSDSLEIIKPGVYHLTGELENGMVSVKAGDGVVKLVLDNVEIHNENGPAIYCESADEFVIELVGNNELSDGTEYDSALDSKINSAIYSKDDLSFIGDGTLTLAANYQDGIASKDDLKFRSGNYVISSVDDAIRGKDSVYIIDGSFDITSGGHAIRSTNETRDGKGFILVNDGDFKIDSEAKGLVAYNSILVKDGSFEFATEDDAIHSNNYVGIKAGTLSIASGDDGIHADAELLIDGGDIKVTKSYEGLEAQKVTINGGTISIKSSDDGINAAGGADSSAMNRIGAGTFDVDEEAIISVNGGYLYVNASGDGIDSNGMIYFNGGEVYVDGPTNSGNGALDSGESIVMNGGLVIAVGASGMAESLGNTSSIFNASIYFDSTLAAGTKVEIKNADGDTLISHTSAKTFNHMAVGCKDFVVGGTYTIFVNGSSYEEFTIESIMTTVGSGSGMQSDGNVMPGGDMSENMGDGTMPNMGDGETPTKPENGEMPEMPNGANPQDMGQQKTK